MQNEIEGKVTISNATTLLIFQEMKKELKVVWIISLEPITIFLKAVKPFLSEKVAEHSRINLNEGEKNIVTIRSIKTSVETS